MRASPRRCDSGRFVADLVISFVDRPAAQAHQRWLRAGRRSAASPAALPDWAQWRDELFGLTFEPAVIVYNRAYFADKPVPASRFDLIDLLRDSDAFQRPRRHLRHRDLGRRISAGLPRCRAGDDLGPAGREPRTQRGAAVLLHRRHPRPRGRWAAADRLQCAWLLRPGAHGIGPAHRHRAAERLHAGAGARRFRVARRAEPRNRAGTFSISCSRRPAGRSLPARRGCSRPSTAPINCSALPRSPMPIRNRCARCRSARPCSSASTAPSATSSSANGAPRCRRKAPEYRTRQTRYCHQNPTIS